MTKSKNEFVLKTRSKKRITEFLSPKKKEKYVRRIIRFSVETKIFEFDIVSKIGTNKNIETDNISSK